MATIVLGIAGNAIAPGVGGFIGGAIGGIIDSQFLLPALFPTETLQGPRLGDMQLTTAAEGAPMKWVIGPYNRVGGTLIWMPKIKEVVETTSVGKGGSGQDVENYKYFASLAVGFADTQKLPGGKVKAIRKIWADTKVIYDDKGPTNKYKSIQIYKGDQTTPNSLMEAVEGTGNVPSYNGIAFVVIEDLELTEFGNRVPNLTAWVEQDSDVSLGDAIALILNRGGIDDSEFDVSQLPYCFRGFVASGQQSLAGMLSPLLLGYGVGCQSSAGKLTFFPRGAERVVQIDPTDLAAHEEGADAPRSVQLTDIDGFNLPTHCTVRFVSTANDLQQGSESYRRMGSRSEMAVDLPMTLDPETAKSIAKRMVWTADVERVAAQVDLPPSYIDVCEGEMLEFTVDGVLYQIYVATVARGNNGRLHIDGVQMQQQTYTYTSDVATRGYTGQSAYRPSDTVLMVADCCALHSTLVDKAGPYFVVCNKKSTDQWQGSTLFSSTDDTTYASVVSQPYEGTIGFCIDSLQSGTVTKLDTRNTLMVKLYNGTLSSCTKDELLAGSNRALVQTTDGDWEMIGFQTATLVTTGTYILSNLLRGRRGTEHLVGKHAAGNQFILLQHNAVGFVDSPTKIGVQQYFKAPASQGDIDDYQSVPLRLKGRSALPFAPCHVELQYDTTSGDYIFTWTRRTKAFMKLLSGTPFTPDEAPEGYIIEVLVSPGYDAAVQRSATTTVPTWTYTSAMQTDDVRAPGDAVTVKIYQRSNLMGRGIPAHVTFNP